MFVSLGTIQRVRYYASDISIITRYSLNVVGQMTSCSEDIQQMSPSLCISEDPMGISSLVPRPSTPPVFDRLQYAKTEGEGLGNFIT